jgi:D-beta-D-heptose 7-phosphate kinase/D-beta-D-heptose 1-phosphate adenosyltransferase
MNLDFLDRVSVLVVGDIMLDRYLWGGVRRISPEAPVPVVEVLRETATAGGAANVALNLAALGVRTEVFGLVGDDASGREVAALLASQGVLLDPRLRRAGVSTITKSRVMAQRQQVCRLDWEAKPDQYTLQHPEALELLADKAATYDAVILSDYAKGVIAQPVIDRLRALAQQRPLFLAMDPKPKRALDVRGMHLLTPNRGEAIELSGLAAEAATAASLDELCREIHMRYDPEHLVVTLSEEGILLSSRTGSHRRFPTVAREVADVSGAGDTVVATLTAALAAGVPPADAVHIANVAAGLVVAKLGTATVTRPELAHALRNEAGEGSGENKHSHQFGRS